MSGPFKVVLVHGRAAAFEIPAWQSQQWTEALQFALTRVGSRFAGQVEVGYASYGDIWRPDARAAMPRFRTAEGREVTLQGDPPRIREGVKGPQPGGPVGAASTLADALLPDFVLGRMLRAALPDVFEYLEDAVFRAKADQRLIETCTDPTPAAVLVGFSMGSIVGYQVLRDAPADFPVRAFITVGSPVGLGPVNRPLRKLAGDEDAKTPFPAGLRLWLNIWNDDDVATGIHGQALADLFPDPDPDGRRTIQNAQNTGRTASASNVFGAHDALDYLSSLAMGVALHTALLDAESQP